MADITVTAAQVARVFPECDEVVDVIAGVDITAGQAVYQLTTGKFGIADANDSGKEQFRGIALKTVKANQAVSILKRGFIAGFSVSGSNGDAILYLSDTAGALADAASGTKTVRCGRVFVLPDSVPTKIVYIQADWLNNW